MYPYGLWVCVPMGMCTGTGMTHGLTIVQGNTNNNTTSAITKNCTVAEFHQKTTEIGKKIQHYCQEWVFQPN